MGIYKYVYLLIENYLLNPKIDVRICTNDGKAAILAATGKIYLTTSGRPNPKSGLEIRVTHYTYGRIE